MKNLTFFELAMLVVFGLAAAIGLFVFATYRGDTGGVTAGPVVVWGVLPRAEFESALVEMNRFDKSFEKVTYIEYNPAQFRNELVSAVAANRGPDLVIMSHEDLLSIRELLKPIPYDTISERTFADSFIDEAALLKTSGGFWGIPFLVDPLVLFYNRSILSSSGIAEPPATWEALTGLVPKTTIVSSAGKLTRSLVPFGAYTNVEQGRGILSALFLQSGVPISIFNGRGGTILLNSNPAGGGFPGEAVIRFYAQFADPAKLSYTWNESLPNSREAFLAGDLALYFDYASNARRLAATNPNLRFDITELPQPATASSKMTYGVLYALALPSGAKNVAGGWKVATLLANKDRQQIISAATGFAPASRAALSEGTRDPVRSVAYTSALYARGWLSPPPSSTDRVFSDMIANVTSGRLSIPEALALAERTLAALLP